ncbi:hypothetical protein O6H91_17G035400 [Diphasiastrum complanatum]|uniref:Uncharacterized protein n=1 Tax=Diphasiastrum complanatum TaxID=34168 RepID=A0ACC2B5P7_DIPCM|nr:hypothetical protein O6H91_17G035400 [Diphasiastrum complanatum]
MGACCSSISFFCGHKTMLESSVLHYKYLDTILLDSDPRMERLLFVTIFIIHDCWIVVKLWMTVSVFTSSSSTSFLLSSELFVFIYSFTFLCVMFYVLVKMRYPVIIDSHFAFFVNGISHNCCKVCINMIGLTIPLIYADLYCLLRRNATTTEAFLFMNLGSTFCI